ncbi:MAG: hypothetical protein HGA87_01125 [Desulfobulbaceae bacterium]|nr:hypothetical protein [Desulfobulbaceae bacterium]
MKMQTIDAITGKPKEFGYAKNGTTGTTGTIVPFIKDGVEIKDDPLFKYDSNGSTVFVASIEAKGGKVIPFVDEE